MDFREAQAQIRTIVRKYLPEKEYRVFIFGSRATCDDLKWSDIDVGIEGEGPISASTKISIEDDLEQSNIPFTVEVVDFSKVTKRFRNVALRKTIPL
jgi:predicted nucleotidyltransferase